MLSFALHLKAGQSFRLPLLEAIDTVLHSRFASCPTQCDCHSRIHVPAVSCNQLPKRAAAP